MSGGGDSRAASIQSAEHRRVEDGGNLDEADAEAGERRARLTQHDAPPALFEPSKFGSTSSEGSRLKVAVECEADDHDVDPLNDPWNLVRIAMGSLAGAQWRLKHVLIKSSEFFTLRPIPAGESLQSCFRGTQTYDDFRCAMPFRPNTTNNTVDVVLIGDANKLKYDLHLEQLLELLSAFVGFRVKLRDSDREPIQTEQPVSAQRSTRTSAMPSSTSADGGLNSQNQVNASRVLVQLVDSCNPEVVCTIGLTGNDLCTDKEYDFVTGVVEVGHRVAIYSCARHYLDWTTDQTGSLSPAEFKALKKDFVTQSFLKTLCRETFKLCGMRECLLVECLMNPFPGGPPEAVAQLPLKLCGICARKLQWLVQLDLLDWYASLHPVIAEWFPEEAAWLQARLIRLGTPTSESLASKALAQPTRRR